MRKRDMILLSGLLVASSLWAQDSSSDVEDETGKVPVKAYFENGKFHFSSKNEKFHLWFDNRIYLDAVVYSPSSDYPI